MEIRLTDMEISREEFINYTILKEKENLMRLLGRNKTMKG